MNGQWRSSHSFIWSCRAAGSGVESSALLKTTLCCCGLQAVTTYWPGLDQAWISSVINGLVSENHLSGTACLVGLDLSLWWPLISTMQDLRSMFTHRGGMCANTAEKWHWMCGSVCAFFFFFFYVYALACIIPAILSFRPILRAGFQTFMMVRISPLLLLMQIAVHHFSHIHSPHKTRDLTVHIYQAHIYNLW